jgi:RNA polymerase sigma-70 factor (ECF subfamily)
LITESLIKNCIKGDSKAREELYKIYSPKLFAISLKYSRNYAEAEDNLHDAFLLIFDKISLFSFKGSFDGWIKKVVINHIL